MNSEENYFHTKNLFPSHVAAGHFLFSLLDVPNEWNVRSKDKSPPFPSLLGRLKPFVQ